MLDRTIDKLRYRAHLKRLTITAMLLLLCISLGSSTLLITLFGGPSGSNFWLNAAGVLIALVSLMMVFQRLRNRPWFYEIDYVLRIKQQLTAIQRRLPLITESANSGDINACIVLAFYYEASAQIWQLDDNTLLLADLLQQQTEFSSQLTERHLTIDAAAFNANLLDQWQ
jgi:predicted alpha/beta-fold hydrolase